MENAEKIFYKSNVEIGGEIFEQIEYRDYTDSCIQFRELMDEKFNLLDTLFIIPFYGLRRKVKDIYYGIRYGFQRMFKGYDKVDIFETFQNFIDRYSKIFADYRKNHVSYIGSMTEKEWDDIIDKMIIHLHYMDETNVINELEKDVSDNWSLSIESIDMVRERHKEEFFKLFSKYFYHLWD